MNSRPFSATNTTRGGQRAEEKPVANGTSVVVILAKHGPMEAVS